MSPEVDNQAIYDDNWDQWTDLKQLGPASRWLRSLIQDHLDTLPTDIIKTVLDLGCGEGTNTAFLADRLPACEQVTGIDFSSTGIQCAQHQYQRPNLNFAQDTESRALENHYHLITSFEVLEHVEDWQSLLGRMADAADYLLLSFPTGRMRPFEVNIGHFRNFQHGEVEAFLQERNFTPVKLSYAGFPFYSPLYREVCNLTNAASNSYTRGEFGWSQKCMAHILYHLFRHASTQTRLGDQFVGTFKKTA